MECAELLAGFGGMQINDVIVVHPRVNGATVRPRMHPSRRHTREKVQARRLDARGVLLVMLST